MKKIIVLSAFMLSVMSISVIAAPTIEVLALFAGKAMLRIDGKQQLLKAGDTSPEGVTLISATGRQAVVEVEQKQYTLEPTTVITGDYKTKLPEVTVEKAGVSTNVTGAPNQPAPSDGKGSVTIGADMNNQYNTKISINGKVVDAIVDTGANTVAMSSQHAIALGLDYSQGAVGVGQTASGNVAMYGITVESIKLGDIEVKNVETAILEGGFPSKVLLGMTFLNQVHMTNEKGVMHITKK